MNELHNLHSFPLTGVERAKKQGAKVALTTAQNGSAIGARADDVLLISAPDKMQKEVFQSVQPMGSLFEQSLLLVLDKVILLLMAE